ncbi:MAG: molybdopterin-dependent oxidoreductase [Candidatus Aenigmatarchaeota archaeon]
MRTVKSSCIYCGCGCRLNFLVDGNKIKKVLPDKEDPVSKGNPCIKGLTINEVVDKGRILYPMVRYGKKLKKTTWKKAYEYIKKKLKDLSPDEIFFVPSGKTTNENNFVMQKFARLLGSNNVDACCSRVCHRATVQAINNVFGITANPWRMDEIYDRDCILIIGSNPASNYPVLFNRILEAKKKGAKILCVQPIKNQTSQEADLLMLIHAGTETAFLNGLMNFLIENKNYDKSVEKIDGFKELVCLVKDYTPEKVCGICGISKKDFENFSKLIAESKFFGAIHGMGLTQHVNAIENVHSLLNLVLLKNGKLLSFRGEVSVQGAGDMGGSPDELPVGQMINFERLEKFWGKKIEIKKGKNILEAFILSPVKACFVSGFNPAQSMPNLNQVQNNLKKMFLIQLDSYFNLTSKFAKVILPIPLLIEKNGTITNGERRVRLVKKVIEPPGEAKPEWLIFKELSKYFGLEKFFNYKNEKEILKEITEVIPAYMNIDPDFLIKGNDAWADKEIKFKKFMPENFEGLEDVRSKKYPFILTTFRSPYRFLTNEATSKSKTLKKFEVDLCYINEKDAKRLKIRDGDKVEISNQNGKVKAKTKIKEFVPQGIVAMHFHSEKILVNKLFPIQFDEESFQPNFKIVAVKIKKLR